MPAHENAYAAPQTTDLRVAVGHSAPRLHVEYLWQGTARGLAAGLFASFSMLLLYVVRMLSGHEAEAQSLFLIAGIFIGVTMALGLVWGIAYACFAKLAPTLLKMNQVELGSDEVRGAL